MTVIVFATLLLDATVTRAAVDAFDHTHSKWTEVLSSFSSNGLVNYRGLKKDRQLLDDYLVKLIIEAALLLQGAGMKGAGQRRSRIETCSALQSVTGRHRPAMLHQRPAYPKVQVGVFGREGASLAVECFGFFASSHRHQRAGQSDQRTGIRGVER